MNPFGLFEKLFGICFNVGTFPKVGPRIDDLSVLDWVDLVPKIVGIIPERVGKAPNCCRRLLCASFALVDPKYELRVLVVEPHLLGDIDDRSLLLQDSLYEFHPLLVGYFDVSAPI